MLQSHIYKLSLRSKLRKDIHLPLSRKVLPTMQQDTSTWDPSPYGEEIFVSIQYGFSGFLAPSLLAFHGFIAGAAYVV